MIVEMCESRNGGKGQGCEGEPDHIGRHFGHDLGGNLVTWSQYHVPEARIASYADQRAHDVFWMTAAERNEAS